MRHGLASQQVRLDDVIWPPLNRHLRLQLPFLTSSNFLNTLSLLRGSGFGIVLREKTALSLVHFYTLILLILLSK